MIQVLPGGDVSNETKFVDFLTRGSPPEDYEAQLLREHSSRVKAIFEGKIVPPYELEIQPTAKCNLKCRHCFGRDYCKLGDKIGLEEMKVIAERVDEFRENGFSIDVVKFCGATGEPFVVQSPAQRQVVLAAHRRGGRSGCLHHPGAAVLQGHPDSDHQQVGKKKPPTTLTIVKVVGG